MSVVGRMCNTFLKLRLHKHMYLLIAGFPKILSYLKRNILHQRKDNVEKYMPYRFYKIIPYIYCKQYS